MKKQLLDILACPKCRSLLTYKGTYSKDRLQDGLLTCSGCEAQYQVLDQIGILVDQGLSAGEFKWEVDVSELKDFDALQADYDAAVAADVLEARAHLSQYIIDKVSTRPGQLLDMATGMGMLFRQVAARVAATADAGNSQPPECLATDVDTTVLRGTQRKTADSGNAAVASFVNMDSCHLALQDEVIDTVISMEGFANIPNGPGAMAQAARVLRPGGLLIFSTLLLNEDSASFQLAADHDHNGLISHRRVEEALTASGLEMDGRQDFVSGQWAGCPYDLLPLEGDWFAHAVYTATKPE
jgi:ubiquinone/menaquinone biosynthesis C-methylase UbiE/uncharacterized protein YbaR (Trm112 family)